MNMNFGSFENIYHHFPIFWEYHGDSLYLKNPPPEIHRAFVLFSKIILEMHKLCEKNGSRLILVVLPNKGEFDGALRGENYDPGTVASYVRKVATEHDILFLDLYSFLKEEKNPLKIFISNEYHYNQEGHRFIADKLFEYFISLLESESGSRNMHNM